LEKVKKILVLGSTGMLGHMTFNYLQNNGFDVYATSRGDDLNKNIFQFDAFNSHQELESIIIELQPDYIINCIGVLVSNSIEKPNLAIFINSFFPHYVAGLSEKYNFNFFHISTDCVFNGKNGPYGISSLKDESNYYGLSKNLGEVLTYKKSLTIRTSIIGPEVSDNKTGLFDWVMNQNNKIKGYSKVIWSGLTTLELSKFIQWMINHNTNTEKIIHATNGIGISKFDLLSIINKEYQLNLILEKDSSKSSNKHLLKQETLAYHFPNYSLMIKEQREWMLNNKVLYLGNYPNLEDKY
jgi:dTDP-4-dehydrorhamnose reductase